MRRPRPSRTGAAGLFVLCALAAGCTRQNDATAPTVLPGAGDAGDRDAAAPDVGGAAFDAGPDTPDDEDDDGVADGEDNCPGRANPGQSDTDGDGVGDACDPCPDGPGEDADDDADGFGRCTGDCDDDAFDVRPGARERCDGRDEDCDGVVDEGFDGVGEACSLGRGACLAEGVLVCTADALAVECDAFPEPPRTEQCNDIDDDCDGSADEGVAGCCEPGETQPCGVGVGVCVRGEARCGADGRFGACDAPMPEDEICNGLDDDCDGRADESVAGAGEACRAGAAGVCNDGRRICDDGRLVCAAGDPLDAEACNGVDDDCDGEVDEAVPGTGAPCPPEAGECGQRVRVCRDAALVCEAQGAGAPETCDGEDDDCDGRIDEGAGEGARPCVSVLSPVRGDVDGGRLGVAMALAGDLDGDGFVDVAIGAPGGMGVPGRVRLVSGRTGRVLDEAGGAADDRSLGAAIAAADLDGDGETEIVVGAPEARQEGASTGRVDVWSGVPPVLIDRQWGTERDGRFGAAVAAAPGPRLILVGAPFVRFAGQFRAGQVFAYALPGPEVPIRAMEPVWDIGGPSINASSGASVGFAPRGNAGAQRPFASQAEDGGRRVLVMRAARDGAADGPPFDVDMNTRETFGLATDGRLANRLLAGAWSVPDGDGPAVGRVWLLTADGQAVSEVVGGPGQHLGFSVTLLAGQRPGRAAIACAGGPGAPLDAGLQDDPRPGHVRCWAPDGTPLFELSPDAGQTGGFGWSLAGALTADPDGRALLAVGAPGADGGRGAVYLYRVSAQP
ncbi:MAG: MopE-related protein [Planctomycetota bacterium]|jgi:hypothetical protein